MIPDDAALWEVAVRGSEKLAATLADQRDLALLFKQIATVRTDAPVAANVDQLAWIGPTTAFEEFCTANRMESLLQRTWKLMAKPL